MKKYGFSVKKVEAIDINRILNEAGAGTNVVIIARREDIPIAVFFREDFLKRFLQADEISVASERLYPEWGYNVHPRIYYYNMKIGANECDQDAPEPLPVGWRGRAVTYAADTLLADIELAKAFVRRIVVHIFHD